MRYCPICNASSDKVEFVGDICISCFRAKESVKLPGKLSIIKCKRCGRVKTTHGWEREREDALNAIAAKQLKVRGYAVSLIGVDYNKGKAIAFFETEAEGSKVGVEREVDLELKSGICDICYRKAAGYWEAIVQLRGRQENVKKIAAKLSAFLDRRNAFVSKEEEYGYGMDVYTSDKKMTQSFLEGHGIKAKKSFQLYGMKNGKKVYRHVFSVELT